MGLIESLEPIIRHLPEVPRPVRKLNLKERFFWTGLALAIYLVMSHVPLYGVRAQGGLFEQLAFFRVVFASKRGSLMELGIGPIVTAGLIMQILVGSKLLKIDLSKPRERALFTGAQKLLAIIMTGVEGAAFILGGAYGLLTLEISSLVLAQLIAVGIIVILLDELVQKGWGVGSGISLFILAGVSQQIAWLSLSPLGPVADGKQLGALIAFGQTLLAGENILSAFSRHPYPDMTGFFTMIAIFLTVVYLEGMRIEIPVAYAKYGGLRAKIPLKFLYVSNVPIILASALFANILFFARVIWLNFNPNNSHPALNMIVQFNATGGGYVPLPGSFVYYMTPVQSLAQAYEDPLHAIVYTLVLCLLSVVFAIVWVQVSGMSAKDQAEQLVKAGLHVPGFRSSSKIIEQVLNRYIPPLTIVSGFIVGLIASIADMLGALGSGIGILLSVGIIYQYYETLARERLEEVYPSLSRVFGK